MPTYIPEGFKILGEREAEFHRSQALEDKTLTPIQQGSLAVGWLRFVLQDIRFQDMKYPWTLTLHFEDYLGKLYSANLIIKEERKEFLYYPGGGNPVKPKP